MNKLIPLAAVAVAAIAGGAYFLSGGGAEVVAPASAQESVANDAADTSTALDGITEMVLGDENAPITIVEYASYTCPHCASFHAGAFKDIKENYIDTGKVKFVYREVYFDRYGLWGSMIARCGDNSQRFFGISDLLYTKQREWTASGDPATIAGELRQIGLTAGLTAEEADACLQDADNAQNLVAWYQQNAEADEISSTPSFIIDGKKHSNMSYADFSTLLDEKLGN